MPCRNRESLGFAGSWPGASLMVSQRRARMPPDSEPSPMSLHTRAGTCCLGLWLAAGGQVIETPCKDLTNESHNQTDYGPLRVAHLRGTAQDVRDGSVPNVCVGVFTDAGHKFIAAAKTDENRHFETSDLPDGDYRLVAKYEGFCPANAKLRIQRRLRGARPLVAQMRFAALDTCSYIELR